MTFLQSGLLFLLGLIVSIFGSSALHSAAPLVGQTLPSATASFETSLQSAITSSASTMTLTANAVRGGGTLSGYNCFTIDEGSSQAETTCGTVSGTTVSSLTRGISQSTGTTTVAALQFAHRRGANVKITDFPLIQILKAQANGEDTYPNILSYTSGTACSGTSGNASICDKAYIDGVAVAGASNANETTKGIAELATQIEMASTTSLGSTGASLVLQAKYSTSSPGTAGIWNVITNNAGKIAQSFLDFSQATTWTGAHTFSAHTILSTASSTRFSAYDKIYIGGSATTTIQGAANATSTFSGGIQSANANITATTTLKGCLGCMSGYEVISNTGAGPSSNGSSGSVGATCSTGKVPIGGGANNSINSGALHLVVSAPTATGWTVVYNTEAAGNAGANTMTAYAICVYQ